MLEDSGGSRHGVHLRVRRRSGVNTVVMFSCVSSLIGRGGLTEMMPMTVQSTRLMNAVVSCIINSSDLKRLFADRNK